MSTPRDTEAEDTNWRALLAAWLFAVVGIQGAAGFAIYRAFSSDWARSGQFGDMFGAVNTLFSGAAFAGVLVAIYLQSRELRLQRRELRYTREELEHTREEIRGQREQMELQNRNLERQGFENTFFELLKLHHDIVRSLRFTHGKGLEGRSSFGGYIERFKTVYNGAMQEVRDDEDDASYTYERFSREGTSRVAHYFQNLRQILIFVNEADSDRQALYVEILRAQLSTEEVTLLFYHCVGSGDAELKRLVEKYGMLQALEPGSVIIGDWKNRFHESAFQTHRERA